MGGMGQLIKGVVIGVVLILAIIGTMKILEKAPENSTKVTDQVATKSQVPAPTISITNPTSSTPTQNSSDPDSKISLSEPSEIDKTKDSFTPILENERTAENINSNTQEEVPKIVEYGMLRLATIDFETNDSLLASYQIFNDKNKNVGEDKNTDNAAFRLPAGKYKVVSTLTPSNGTSRKIEPVQSTQFVNIVGDTVVQKLFKMEPPSTIGVLQVSAKDANSNQIMRAGFIVQKENGETVAERKNVSNTLFKLNAGSYKVTVRSGEQSDFRTVVIDAGESTKEVFMLQKTYEQGRLLVRIFDTFSNHPVTANILISNADGKTVQELKSVSKTEISLPEGNYKINVTGAYSQSNKNIRVLAGQTISEVFRFDAPNNAPNEHTNNQQQATDNRYTDPIDNSTSSVATDATASSLILTAISDNNRLPIKSNFYVQTLTGQHIDKKIYSESAKFELNPGNYKITVRAKGKKNLVKNIKVEAGKQINEVFSLRGVNQQSTPNSTRSTSSQTPTLGGVKPSKSNVVPNGFLQVNMLPPQKTHFIVSTHLNKKIVELTSVTHGNFKLDTGVYNVTAILNGKRRSKSIRVNTARTSQLNFRSNEFQEPRQSNNAGLKGILRSRIVDQAGRPLKGNLFVTNPLGRIVGRANNVSEGIFTLAPTSHVISVSFRGLQGSERINIQANQTTMQTFTIAPPPSKQEQPRKSTKDILRDRLEQEIRKRF